ncbi:hypothetical protein Aperf_G00000102965 [Anoplocephala perfoliata]
MKQESTSPQGEQGVSFMDHSEDKTSDGTDDFLDSQISTNISCPSNDIPDVIINEVAQVPTANPLEFSLGDTDKQESIPLRNPQLEAVESAVTAVEKQPVEEVRQQGTSCPSDNADSPLESNSQHESTLSRPKEGRKEVGKINDEVLNIYTVQTTVQVLSFDAADDTSTTESSVNQPFMTAGEEHPIEQIQQHKTSCSPGNESRNIGSGLLQSMAIDGKTPQSEETSAAAQATVPEVSEHGPDSPSVDDSKSTVEP